MNKLIKRIAEWRRGEGENSNNDNNMNKKLQHWKHAWNFFSVNMLGTLVWCYDAILLSFHKDLSGAEPNWTYIGRPEDALDVFLNFGHLLNVLDLTSYECLIYVLCPGG